MHVAQIKPIVMTVRYLFFMFDIRYKFKLNRIEKQQTKKKQQIDAADESIDTHILSDEVIYDIYSGYTTVAHMHSVWFILAYKRWL